MECTLEKREVKNAKFVASKQPIWGFLPQLLVKMDYIVPLHLFTVDLKFSLVL